MDCGNKRLENYYFLYNLTDSFPSEDTFLEYCILRVIVWLGNVIGFPCLSSYWRPLQTCLDFFYQVLTKKQVFWPGLSRESNLQPPSAQGIKNAPKQCKSYLSNSAQRQKKKKDFEICCTEWGNRDLILNVTTVLARDNEQKQHKMPRLRLFSTSGKHGISNIAG